MGTRKTRLIALAAGVLVIGSVGGSLLTGPTKATDVPTASEPSREDSYSTLLRASGNGEVRSVLLDAGTSTAEVAYRDGSSADVQLPPDNTAVLDQLAASGAYVAIDGHLPVAGTAGGGSSLVPAVLPTLLLFVLLGGFFGWIRRRANAMNGMPDTSLRRSAELEVVPRQRFTDVAGCDEAVEELSEIVEFFEDPARFDRLGARMPSGIMLYGDPGTGKTLLAKALAGEAGIPFYATSGSDFVEKFVGVGASRVRELFAKARRHEHGAVVFIDEIDAVGRARSATDANGEREQTLNQILVELDGFSSSDRVVCIAATNRLDVLDPALLRPGRFGRHISVPLPSAGGRTAILGVHAAGKPLAPDVDLSGLAATMSGLSGAQLAEVVNEAAIMAGRAGRQAVEGADFREAYLRVLAGPRRRSAPLADGELEVIACHEAGHVLAAEHGGRYEKAQQVTIEPRGQAMGLAVYGQSDRALHDPEYLHEALVATLAGRAAEQTVFRRVSSGAANDLQKANELARRAVLELGFSPRLGQLVAGRAPFSQATQAVVDAEIERMVADAYADALALLARHRDQLDRLTARLLEQRVLERVDILAALRPAPRAVRPALVPARTCVPDTGDLADSRSAAAA